ncbi:MAG TPA: acyltransferase family protein, partial [Acidimicrobiales bacterium]
FHLDRLQGGFLGVDLFFVLSGFLITSLLLSESRRTGGVALGAFWARRARRLLPALWATVAGVAVLLLRYTPEAERARFRDDAVSTLAYVFNWDRLAETTSYWDLFTQPSPLEHMWSLAIEEQFYVLWPLVVFGLVAVPGLALAPARVRVVALAGGAASLLGMALTYDAGDTNLAYFSTLTRLGPLLLGAALATVTVHRRRRTRPPRPEVDVMAAAALFVMAVLVVSASGLQPMYYRGGLAVFALCACVVIAAVTGGPVGRVGWLLTPAPLQWLGRVSYGVYLWHWPVIVFMTPARLGVDRWATDLARIATTLAVAELSYRYLEMPIRRGALPGRRAWAGTAAAVAVALGLSLVATAGETKVEDVALDEDQPLAGIDNPVLRIPAPDEIPPGAVKVLLVGDSGAAAWGPELVEVAEEESDGDAVGAFAAQISCTIVYADGPGRLPDGRVVERDRCHEDRAERWRRVVDEYDPDVVVYYLANVGFMEEHRLNGEWVPECDPRYGRYFEDALAGEADLLTARGAGLVLATSPYTATMVPGGDREVECRNAAYRRFAAAHPGVRVADLHAFVIEEGPRGDMFEDPVHLSEYGGRQAARWLLPQVEEWYG